LELALHVSDDAGDFGGADNPGLQVDVNRGHALRTEEGHMKIVRYIVDIEVPDDVSLTPEKIDAALSVVPAAFGEFSQDIVARCVRVDVPARASWYPEGHQPEP
jgi:hypothetical protein